MKQKKVPYIHFIPRVLLSMLAIGALVALIYVPLMAGDALSVHAVADSATALPTAAPEAAGATLVPPSASPAPTFAPSAASSSPASDVVVLSTYTTLRLGDDNASVSSLQQRLSDLGYLDSDMPGSLFNESIAGAVILFQRACNMPQTGIADNDTQLSLFDVHAQVYRIKRFDTGTDVVRLQQRLEELGYYSDRVNGYFGPHTEQAVMSFQMLNGLAVTGELSYADWAVLYSDEAVPAPVLPTSSPTPRITAAPKTAKPTAKPTTKTTAKATTKATAKATATPEATAKATATPKATASGGSTEKATATPKVTPTEKPTATPKATANSGKKTYSSLIDAAQDQIGKPYEWSCEGPNSFDCSGLVYYCMKQSGQSISRQSAKSYASNSKWTLITSMDDLKAGDLVFFKNDSSETVSHTGICISSSTMIHASSSKGEVTTSRLHQDYWERNFVCGRRP